MTIWNGVCVETLAQSQTLRPKPSLHQIAAMQKYAGYELMQIQWYDLGIPEIPLDIRYTDFCRRLSKATGEMK